MKPKDLTAPMPKQIVGPDQEIKLEMMLPDMAQAKVPVDPRETVKDLLYTLEQLTPDHRVRVLRTMLAYFDIDKEDL